MSGLAWTKFYWSDWDSDPALRLCSLAAQGLWMRMLCIAAAHDPIGYVAVAGQPLDETAIARMTGGGNCEVAALLLELDRNGVCSRDRLGRIYCRRMLRDARKFAAARRNGKLGGNPSLGKDGGNLPSDKAPDKPRLKPQKPEARSQRTKKAAPSELSLLSPAARPPARAEGADVLAPEELERRRAVGELMAGLARDLRRPG